MIKNVKDFSAQFQAKSLGKSRGFGDRNVRVIERRTDNQVSAQIAKARDRSKDSVEPGINRPRILIGPTTSGLSVPATPFTVLLVVTTLSGLPLWDCTIAQAAIRRPIGFCERQFVQCADDKTVTRIEVRKATTSDQVIAVLGHDS